jgi:hypothetical protein
MACKTCETPSASIQEMELEIWCQSIYSAAKPVHGDQRRLELLGLYNIETTVLAYMVHIPCINQMNSKLIPINAH